MPLGMYLSGLMSCHVGNNTQGILGTRLHVAKGGLQGISE